MSARTVLHVIAVGWSVQTCQKFGPLVLSETWPMGAWEVGQQCRNADGGGRVLVPFGFGFCAPDKAVGRRTLMLGCRPQRASGATGIRAGRPDRHGRSAPYKR